ncbi:tetratricopeptide (TPR) repeat protein [Azospirillum fermentarium]|uniref:tetratricopeptide repeat protein n=1 Tax=Azospirillum fermentarium TaxID=1233114 RepID=UPI0022264EB8|nr:tetratricopeptide repeat protein [Azospirillum fermentarium]MCW2247893.1 tetratricopeptide (TPR) repeat protein [Azospirillum fermentarium]
MPSTRPSPAAGRLHEALAHHQAGRLDRAEPLYRMVVRTEPRNADALHLLGIVLLQTGRAAEALALVERAIAANRRLAAFHDTHGSVLAALGRHQDAANAHARALRLDPAHTGARFNFANALHAWGHPPAAVTAFHQTLALNPAHGKAWFNMGNALRTLGAADAAVEAFTRAIALDPDMAEAHNNLGDALAAVGRHDEAVAQHRLVVRQRPADARSWYNLGAALQQHGTYEEAEIAYREALRRDPRHVPSLNNLGGVLRRLNHPEHAEDCHRQAIALSPDFAESYHNLGNALAAQGRYGEAMACHEEALSRNPDLATATHGLALLALMNGDLAHGLAGYERRFAARAVTVDRPLPPPRWDGTPLDTGRLVLWREQGVGMETLFAATLADAAARARGPVTLYTDPRLVPLFARSFPAVTVVDEAELDRAPPADMAAHCPTGSLPGLLRRDLAAVPAAPWLAPDPVRVAAWRDRLAALGPGLTVGIGWRTAMLTPDHRPCYVPLDRWAPLFAVPGVHLVSLQYGETEDEIRRVEARTGVTIHRWDGHDLTDDIDGTAALIAALDLVVSPAMAAGDLAAALGVPVWRFAPREWTQLGTGTRPWCPGTRLFRPPHGAPMDAVIAPMAAALARLAPPVPVPAARRPAPPAPDARAAAEEALERAIGHHRAGRLAAAESAYREALAHDSRHGDALNLLGLLYHQAGHQDEALSSIDRALAADPAFAEAFNHRGLIQQALGRPAAARDSFARALALRPAFAEAYTHRGLVTEGTEQEACHRRAGRLDPANPAVHVNLGVALEKRGAVAGAARQYRQALALQPALPDTLNNLASLEKALGRTGPAARLLRRAERLAPGFPLVAWNLGLIRLETGDLPGGWAGFEHRFSSPHLQRGRRIAAPGWRGDALAGRRLLVWGEQGVGDEILFASCYPPLRDMGGTVVLECDPRLTGLFARSFPWAEVREQRIGAHGRETAAPDAAVQIAAGSLPALMRGRLTRFPDGRAGGWITADSRLVERWRGRLAALGPGLKVGIGWRSQVMTAQRQSSYITAPALAPLLRVPGLVAVNLQYGPVAAEIAAAEALSGRKIHRWDDLDLTDDFENTAALMAALDLVVSPAMSAGELAGALGVPVWRFGPSDWTRLGSGCRPWYPAMRLFTPPPGAPLDSVVIPMAQDLHKLLDQPGAPLLTIA